MRPPSNRIHVVAVQQIFAIPHVDYFDLHDDQKIKSATQGDDAGRATSARVFTMILSHNDRRVLPWTTLFPLLHTTHRLPPPVLGCSRFSFCISHNDRQVMPCLAFASNPYRKATTRSWLARPPSPSRATASARQRYSPAWPFIDVASRWNWYR